MHNICIYYALVYISMLKRITQKLTKLILLLDVHITHIVVISLKTRSDGLGI